MKSIIIICATCALLFISSCAPKDEMEAKKNKLEQLKKEVATLNQEISQIEKELATAGMAAEEFLIAVGVDTLQKQGYVSSFEFQAVVESDKNVMLTTENPGTVTAILVKEGQMVQKGQLLLTLDASLIEAQIAELNKALELAEKLFAKQDRLYKQNIGTELQFLEAKNRFESLQKQKASAAQRLSKSKLVAPFSGVVDMLNTSLGSFANPGIPLIRLVDNTNLKIVAQVPESYLGQIEKGDTVQIRYPGINQSSKETVYAVSQVINADNRTFQVFIKPTKSKLTLSPNLLAIVSATDYAADSVLVVPTQIVKRDTENNPYVFVVTKQDNQNMIAKRMLTIQRFGADFSIVSDGLAPGDLLVTKGYNSIDVNDKVQVVN